MTKSVFTDVRVTLRLSPSVDKVSAP
jgi:hypothetical protein